MTSTKEDSLCFVKVLGNTLGRLDHKSPVNNILRVEKLRGGVSYATRELFFCEVRSTQTDL